MLRHYLTVQQHEMGQQQFQAKTNIITASKTLVTTSPNENNLHTVAMRRPFASKRLSEGSKYNLEIPAEREFSDLRCRTAGKRRLLLYSFQTEPNRMGQYKLTT
jgi:hypothetical protein